MRMLSLPRAAHPGSPGLRAGGVNDRCLWGSRRNGAESVESENTWESRRGGLGFGGGAGVTLGATAHGTAPAWGEQPDLGASTCSPGRGLWAQPRSASYEMRLIKVFTGPEKKWHVSLATVIHRTFLSQKMMVM